MRWLRLTLIPLVLAFVISAGIGTSVKAPAQLSMMGVGPANRGGAAAPSFTAGASVAIQAHGFGAGTVTFSNLNGGTNFPSGALVIVGVAQDQATVDLTSPQIGGNAASVVAGAQDATKRLTLFQAVMPSASTDNFTFTNGGSVDKVGVAAGYMQNLSSTVVSASSKTDYPSGADPQALTAAIVVPATGFGIAVVIKSAGGAQPTAWLWTSTTSGAGDVFATAAGLTIGLAHTATSGSWNPTASGVTNSASFAAAMAGGTWN